MSVNLKQNPDGSAGLEGTDGNTGSLIFVNIPYTTSTPLTMSGAIFNRKVVVQGVYLVPDVASTNAVTATAYKATTGALGSGTALISAGMAMNGTAGTVVTGTLSTTGGALTLANGDHLGIVVSGALGAAGSGVATIVVNPA
jgi:hypothetical protein